MATHGTGEAQLPMARLHLLRQTHRNRLQSLPCQDHADAAGQQPTTMANSCLTIGELNNNHASDEARGRYGKIRTLGFRFCSV